MFANNSNKVTENRLMEKITISLDKPTVTHGETATFSIQSEHTSNYAQCQIDVFTCGVANPNEVWGAGIATADAITGTISMSLDTSQLHPGIYEIKLVSFHTPINIDFNPKLMQLIGGRDFPRMFLNIIHEGDITLQQDTLLLIVKAQEEQVEDEFLSGISVPNTKTQQQRQYCVFVFFVGAKITRQLKFDRWEVIPFRGMDVRDTFEIAHEFLRDCSKLEFNFPYTHQVLEGSRQDNPVCVAHFPLIIADSFESARDYCRHRGFILGQALSVHRGATPEIICTIVYDRTLDHAKLFTEGTIYRGNLCGGSIAGENAESIEASINAISNSSQMRYLYLLYSYARREEVIDYQYLRYWQFLEAVAESKNYDENADLCDFMGQPIFDDKKITLKIKLPRNQVYELVKNHKLDAGISESNVYFRDDKKVEHKLLEMVTFWYAMRNAAAHYGHFLPDDQVQKANFNYYAKCLKIRKLVGEAGHDYILDDLKNTASLILLRETHILSPRRMG